MSLLNIGISVLALTFYPETYEWLLSEILEEVMCVKDVQYTVSQYDADIPIDLITIKCCLQSTKN